MTELTEVRDEIIKWRKDLMASEYVDRAVSVRNYEGLVILGRLCAYRDTLKLINDQLRGVHDSRIAR